MKDTKILTVIGKCIGCDRLSILNDGVCYDCLTSPSRGRKWAEIAHKCRIDPTYSQTIYNSIKSDRGKKLFILMFGIKPTQVLHEKISNNVIRIY